MEGTWLPRRVIPMAAVLVLLFASDYILGGLGYSGAVDGVILVVFTIFLGTGMLSRSSGLNRLRGDRTVKREPSAGPIGKEVSILSLAMGGDFASRCDIARTLREAAEQSGGAEANRLGRSPVLNPVRQEPGREVKATKSSREAYLRSVEEALTAADPEGHHGGE